MTLIGPVAPVDTGRNARLRRWENTGPAATSSGLPLSAATAGTWFQLENGIQVTFGNGTYCSGDYWTIAARTASGQIDWPPCGGDGNSFQPPHSARVYRAPLACIHYVPPSSEPTTELSDVAEQKGYTVVDDCRQLFSPLTAKSQAIHVEDVSWTNDDIMTFDQLLANGLTICLDQTPCCLVTGANFIVTVESLTPIRDDLAATEIPQDVTQMPSTVLRTVTIVDADITVSDQTLSWQLTADWIQGVKNAESYQDILLLTFGAAAQPQQFARVRVKLLGQMIFASSPSGLIYLDGRAFGKPALRADGTTPRIALQLPSGSDAAASDLDGWFYLAPDLADPRRDS